MEGTMKNGVLIRPDGTRVLNIEIQKCSFKPGYIVARDFQPIPEGCCLDCHREYDHAHSEVYEKCCGFDLYEVFCAETGYCPECVKNRRANADKDIRIYNRELKYMQESPRKQLHHGIENIDVYADGRRETSYTVPHKEKEL